MRQADGALFVWTGYAMVRLPSVLFWGTDLTDWIHFSQLYIVLIFVVILAEISVVMLMHLLIFLRHIIL
jgi:hypothetical protein